MRVVSTFYKPSSVVAAFNSRLSDNELSHLVIAKSNQIEVHSLTAEGLVFRTALEIWGYVVDAKPVRKPSGGGHLIAVLTDHPEPRVLLLEYVLRSLTSQPYIRSVGQLALRSRGLRESEHIHSLTVSPNGAIIIAAPYVGKIRISDILESGTNLLNDLSDANLKEMTILSLAMLYNSEEFSHTLAILHVDHKGALRLCARDISKTLDLSTEYSSRFADTEIPDAYADRLIPVPPSSENPNRHGGLFVVGGQKVHFYPIRPASRKSSRAKGKAPAIDQTPVDPVSVKWEYSTVTAHALIDEDGSRLLLGDGFGRLVLVTLTQPSKGAKPELQCSLVGTASAATSLTYLDCGIVYIGSHQGDHLLIQLTPEEGLPGNHFKVIGRTQNIAPIMDACLVNKDDNKEIVTASGGGNTGSLRIIRNGADFQQYSAVNSIPYIKQIWPIKSRFAAKYDEFLVAATHSQTRVFTSIKDTSMEEIQQSGLDHSVATVACGNIKLTKGSPEAIRDSQLVIQVTRRSIIAANVAFAQRAAEWTSTSSITVASISGTQICVAITGGLLYILSMMQHGGGEAFYEVTKHLFKDQEIACLSCLPHDATMQKSGLLVVGFWGSNEVAIYQQKNLDQPRQVFGMPHVPRSVLLTSFQPPKADGGTEKTHLLVGLGDGSLYQALLDKDKGNALESRTTDLGHRPVKLSHCRTKDGWGAFACGSRATVIYYERGRARHSPLVLKGITGGCSANFEHYTNCMVFSTASGFVIGRIRDVQRLHIQNVPLGYDCPQRVSHHPDLGVLGVGTTRTEPYKVGEAPNATSHFSIFDDLTLERLSSFACRETEEVYSISTVKLHDGLEETSFFALGTVFMNDSEVEPSKGRILIFSVSPQDSAAGTDSRGSWLLISEDVAGCVYAFAFMEGLLLAAVNSAVYLYRLERTAPSRPYKLTKLSEINHNYLINSISTAGSHIFVADTFNSVSMFQLEGAKMTIVAKCYTPNWAVALNALSEKSCLGADSDCNLFIYRVAAAQDDTYFLEKGAFYHFGEMVNKFITGSIATYSEDDPLQAKPLQLFVTSVGRIGVISEFGDDLSLSMTDLQRNLNGVVKGPGNITHAEYRRPTRYTDAEPQAFGFLDGDFLERYLTQSKSELEQIRKGGNDAETLAMSHQAIVQVLEKLQSVH